MEPVLTVFVGQCEQFSVRIGGTQFGVELGLDFAQSNRSRFQLPGVGIDKSEQLQRHAFDRRVGSGLENSVSQVAEVLRKFSVNGFKSRAVNEYAAVNFSRQQFAEVVFGSNITAFEVHPESVAGNRASRSCRAIGAINLAEFFLSVEKRCGLSLLDMVFTRKQAFEPIVAIGICLQRVN